MRKAKVQRADAFSWRVQRRIIAAAVLAIKAKPTFQRAERTVHDSSPWPLCALPRKKDELGTGWRHGGVAMCAKVVAADASQGLYTGGRGVRHA